MFLLVMGSADFASMRPGQFFGMALPFVLLYGLFSISFKRYRANHAVVCFVPVLIMVFVPTFRVFVHFSKDLATLSPRAGGWLLFGLATVDVLVGYLPWRRRVEAKK